MTQQPTTLTGIAVEDVDREPFAAHATIADGGIRLSAADEPSAGLLLPGLVNAHDHLRSLVPPSRAGERMSLTTAIAAANDLQLAVEPDDYRVLTALGAARQVRAGTTTVVDHVYPLHRPGLLDAVVAGHRAVGVRGFVALGVMTRGVKELCTSVEDVVALAERAADTLLPKEQMYLAPVSLRQNDPGDYAVVAEAAQRLGLRTYTHIAELPSEVEDCVAEHGLRPIELLYEAGFLMPGTVLVHGVVPSDREIELMAQTGAALVYCPTNHLRFAKGFAPVVDMIDAGVPVMLGVDGMESLFHEMRQAVYAQGQARSAPGSLGSAQAFSMATRTSAAVLGLPAGFDGGDCVRLDASGPQWHPMADPVWTVVHRGAPADVTDVVVAGRPVLRDGVLVEVDQHQLAHEAADVAQRLARRAGTPVPPLWRPWAVSSPSQNDQQKEHS
ncbi:amidohydrolase family protein [Pseudactinotalea suaedae]|uniref:amidohydrolase family protein n=1 Tax=Pseudactinotalea suaedae TaxID=1524924 RepID=UPI00139076A2|nr:amidohydrolase family protein [Pseudactinotalea suaedae]